MRPPSDHHDHILERHVGKQTALPFGDLADNQIESAGLEQVTKRRLSFDEDFERHVRSALEQQAARIRQQVVRRQGRRSDTNVSADALCEVANLAHEILGHRLQARATGKKELTRRREPDASANAMKEGRPKGRLEPADGLRQRRLAAMDALGRASHVAQLRNRREIPQVSKVEVHLITISYQFMSISKYTVWSNGMTIDPQE